MFTKISFLFLLTSIAVSILFFVPGFGDGFELPKISFILPLLWMSISMLLIDGKYTQTLASLSNTSKGLLFSLLLVEVIAFFASSAISTSFAGVYPRHQGFLLHMSLLLSVPVWIYHLRDTTKQLAIKKSILQASILMTILGILSYFFPLSYIQPANFDNRIFATLGNPNIAAICMLFGFLLLRQLPLKSTYIYVSRFLFTIGILFTGSRLVVMLLILSYVFLLRKKVRMFRYVLLGSIILSICSFSYISNLIQTDTSIQTRIHIWNASIQAIQERSILGYGQDTQRKVLQPYLPVAIQANTDTTVDRPHSVLLDSIITLGIVGFLIYLQTIFYIFKIAFKQNSKELAFMFGIILIFLSINIMNITIQFLILYIVSLILGKSTLPTTK